MLPFPTLPRKPLVPALSALALVLAGCSGRDTEMAEKLARAEIAAKRAEAAAAKAEATAKRISARAPEPAADENPDKDEPAFGEPSVNPDPAA